MAKQTRYQVTAQISAGDWVKRHTSRISRLKLAIEQTAGKSVKARLRIEVGHRVKHLTELKASVRAHLAAIEGATS